jgi:hypothetical protein
MIQLLVIGFTGLAILAWTVHRQVIRLRSTLARSGSLPLRSGPSLDKDGNVRTKYVLSDEALR